MCFPADFVGLGPNLGSDVMVCPWCGAIVPAIFGFSVFCGFLGAAGVAGADVFPLLALPIT